MVVIGQKNIKELTGKVISAKMAKSLVVAVERVKNHPLYRKRYTITKKYYAHDENNQAQEGDIVRIRESKPMSRLKRWMLIEVVKKA